MASSVIGLLPPKLCKPSRIIGDLERTQSLLPGMDKWGAAPWHECPAWEWNRGAGRIEA